MSVHAAYAFAVTACLLTAVAQLMLKAGAHGSHGRHPLRLWWNSWVLASYGLFLGVTLLNLKAFQVLPLKMFVVLNPLVLLMVVAGSRFFFRETLNRSAWGGLGLVLVGVLVFNLPP